jgi:hypothetical protein
MVKVAVRAQIISRWRALINRFLDYDKELILPRKVSYAPERATWHELWFMDSGHVKTILMFNLRTKAAAIIYIALAAFLAAGCKPKPSAGWPKVRGHSYAAGQNESQYVVEEIVSDLAEQMVYAASCRLPDQSCFSVTAAEKTNLPAETDYRL